MPKTQVPPLRRLPSPSGVGTSGRGYRPRLVVAEASAQSKNEKRGLASGAAGSFGTVRQKQSRGHRRDVMSDRNPYPSSDPTGPQTAVPPTDPLESELSR